IEKGNDILNLPVQDPPGKEFSSSHLTWTRVERHNHTVEDVALIPYSRVDDFLKGESDNVECPTRFRIENGRKRSRLSSSKERKPDEYTEFRLYWCAFGPDNYEEGGIALPSRKFRTGGRKRAVRPQAMRGCMCHFIVKRLFSQPSIAVIIYNQRQHVDRTGSVCHGPLDRNALAPRTMTHPYVPNELRQQAMSMIYLGISEESILQKHIEDSETFGGSANVGDLACKYVQKLEMVIRRSSYELDPDDLLSIRKWIERHQNYVFFFQDSSDTDPFILGIQTEWQLQQMMCFGNNSFVAADTTFGINKLKYPLYTLLAFDSNQHALPVAWVITRSSASDDVRKWMGALHDRICAKDPLWKLNGFTVDDAATEISAIRDMFQCPIFLCVWRVRRAWLKNITNKCSNIEVRREMFKRLGHIMYSTWTGVDSVDAISEFVQDFIDQSAFLKYFKSRWVPKIEMWLAAMRILPLASQETSGAIEAYHAGLKTRLFDELDITACQRIDWLVHKLTTEVHSWYWLHRYADESGLLGNIREQYKSSTSWYRALQIPDTDVILDNHDLRFAKVISHSDCTQTHVVWNPGSEFALCDCLWSMQGYLCKHVIKVNMVYCNRQLAQPSMAFHTYHHVLLSMWHNAPDDSIALDHASAHAIQMQQDLKRIIDVYKFEGVSSLVSSFPVMWSGKKGRTSKFRAITARHQDSMGDNITAPDENAEHQDSMPGNTVALDQNVEHQDSMDSNMVALDHNAEYQDSMGGNTAVLAQNTQYQNPVGGNTVTPGQLAEHQGSMGGNTFALGQIAKHQDSMDATAVAAGQNAEHQDSMDVNTVAAGQNAEHQDLMDVNTIVA
ncbi:hypothetical protein KI387_004710, partial [Taxus chinensis]